MDHISSHAPLRARFSSSASSVNSTLKEPPPGKRKARMGSVSPGAFKDMGCPQPRISLKHQISFSLTLGEAKICARLPKARPGPSSEAALRVPRLAAVVAIAIPRPRNLRRSMFLMRSPCCCARILDIHHNPMWYVIASRDKKDTIYNIAIMTGW